MRTPQDVKLLQIKQRLIRQAELFDSPDAYRAGVQDALDEILRYAGLSEILKPEDESILRRPY